MIRLLLIVLGGVAAWRYRTQIKEYANQLPHLQRKASDVVRDATAKLEEGASSPAASREGQVYKGAGTTGV